MVDKSTAIESYLGNTKCKSALGEKFSNLGSLGGF
jgi:hypothetical protein